jgi:hypothetical protein
MPLVDATNEVRSLLDKHAMYEEALLTIAHLWPEPEVCGSMAVCGISDGKSRLITAFTAIHAAREVLGLSHHKFPE